MDPTFDLQSVLSSPSIKWNGLVHSIHYPSFHQHNLYFYSLRFPFPSYNFSHQFSPSQPTFTMAVVLKIQFENEIRRVHLQQSIGAFNELIQLANTHFFNNRSPTPSLGFSYTDEEGDIVSITNEKELLEALNSYTNSKKNRTLKLSVVENEKEELGGIVFYAICSNYGI